MKTIYDPASCSALIERLERLGHDTEGLWGRMTAPRAVCHLSDTFHASLGDTHHAQVGTVLHRTVIRFVALSTPMKWPRGAKTLPAFDQEQGGTPPAAFDADVDGLKVLVVRFTKSEGADLSPHAAFGALTAGEWGDGDTDTWTITCASSVNSRGPLHRGRSMAPGLVCVLDLLLRSDLLHNLRGNRLITGEGP